MRSMRTVRTSGEDRSWFGRTQAIKKCGRECRQQQGDERVESAENHSQRHHSVQVVSSAVGVVYELPKKRSGPTRSQLDASPHQRERNQSDGRNPYWSSPLRPNDYRSRQPEKKQRSHALPVFDGITPYGVMPFNSRAATNPTAIRKSAH